MKKLLMTAAALVAFVTPTLAADKMSAAGVLAGTWCQVEVADAHEGWTFYERGRCPHGSERTVLILKVNGDFILTGEVGDEMECKVKPKSYFKGWADYNCKTYGGSVMKTKGAHKFTTGHGDHGDWLGLNSP